jgi:hypothetical protein
MNYSLKNSVDNSPYTGSDIFISPTTGKISTINLGVFTTNYLKIAVNSIYSIYQCSEIVESSDFIIHIT